MIAHLRTRKKTGMRGDGNLTPLSNFWCMPPLETNQTRSLIWQTACNINQACLSKSLTIGKGLMANWPPVDEAKPVSAWHIHNCGIKIALLRKHNPSIIKTWKLPRTGTSGHLVRSPLHACGMREYKPGCLHELLCVHSTGWLYDQPLHLDLHLFPTTQQLDQSLLPSYNRLSSRLVTYRLYPMVTRGNTPLGSTVKNRLIYRLLNKFLSSPFHLFNNPKK